MFRGREGVKYELSGGGRTSLPILAARDSIQFQFKTTKSTGLLYYNGNEQLSAVIKCFIATAFIIMSSLN